MKINLNKPLGVTRSQVVAVMNISGIPLLSGIGSYLRFKLTN